jgi:hypothetical protein
MTVKVTVTYDAASDSLHIDACPPYKEQESDQIALGVLARTNPTTGAIENIEIRSFQRRLADGQALELPIGLDASVTSA